MLKALRIQNLVLVEKAEIAFGTGLNILTGETGAGKSAILAAIGLICGERADQQLIRKGASFAVVEADLVSLPAHLLEEEGISSHRELVTVRREIHISGKNRCFIDDQQVSLSFLKRCVGNAIERVDQSSSAALCSLTQQRDSLDAYASLSKSVQEMGGSFEEEEKLEQELSSLRQTQMQRDRELEWAESDLAAIQETGWKQGEEEALAEQHHLLTHVQEIGEKLGGICEGAEPIVPLLKRFAAQAESCAKFDSKIKAAAQALLSAGLELEEAARAIGSYLSGIEPDPKRLEQIETRIADIETIKKRFGSTFSEVEQKRNRLLQRIEALSHLEEKIQSVAIALNNIREKNRARASVLTEKRQKAAIPFAKAILTELQSLNLPHAKFLIAIDPKPLSRNGADEIRFLFAANPGHSPTSLEQCASGGELSRLLFSLKIVLAKKESASCLIFDEIDSNVGGQTAAILGEKLKKLSQNRQVVCVTHFVQVARCAETHFRVAKKEQNGEAITAISALLPDEKEKEYQRMLGV